MIKINYSKQRLNGNLHGGIFLCVMGLIITIGGAVFSLAIKGVGLVPIRCMGADFTRDFFT